VTARKIPSSAIASWGVVAVVTVLLAAIGIFVAFHIDSAIENATQVGAPARGCKRRWSTRKARWMRCKTRCRTYLIDGADGMRYQYEDAARSLGSQATAIAGIGRQRVVADRAGADRP